MKSAKLKKTEIGEIPNEWNVSTLGGTATLNYGKSLPEISRNDGGVPVYGSSGIIGWHSEAMVPSEGYVIGRKGSIGTVAYSPVPFYPIDTTFYVTKKDINCDFKYFFYLLKYLNLDKLNFDSAVPGLNREVAYKQSFALPPLNEQQQIASILSSLDDKIELNRKMNKTLEEIGKALFKHWFVDFEFPNENGKPYKSSGGEMVESELGMIPRGWKAMHLGEFFSVATGRENANIAVVRGKFPFFTCANDISWANKYSFDAPAILLAGNGDFNVKWYKGKFEAYQRTYVLIPHNEEYLGFLYYGIAYFLKDITAGHRGSVVNFITKGMVEDFLIAIPDDFREYTKLFNLLNESISKKVKEIGVLSQVRDSLLPRLMSGKLRVD